MKRFCEIYADESGRFIVRFREGRAGHLVTYGDYVSPLPPLPVEIETAYRFRGPFGGRSGSIDRIRVVEP